LGWGWGWGIVVQVEDGAETDVEAMPRPHDAPSLVKQEGGRGRAQASGPSDRANRWGAEMARMGKHMDAPTHAHKKGSATAGESPAREEEEEETTKPALSYARLEHNQQFELNAEGLEVCELLQEALELRRYVSPQHTSLYMYTHAVHLQRALSFSDLLMAPRVTVPPGLAGDPTLALLTPSTLNPGGTCSRGTTNRRTRAWAGRRWTSRYGQPRIGCTIQASPKSFRKEQSNGVVLYTVVVLISFH